LVEIAHLEFRTIGACHDRGIDERDRTIEVAIMIVADLRYHVTWLSVADRTVADPDGGRLAGRIHSVLLGLI